MSRVVTLAEWLLREGVGLGGSLVATAVIAVSFAPARDRLQRWVDRRLYGSGMTRSRPWPGSVSDCGTPRRDVLAGVLQTVCETLRHRPRPPCWSTTWRWRPMA